MTATQVKIPNHTSAICATSVQITERFPPYTTYTIVAPPMTTMVAVSLQPKITDRTMTTIFQRGMVLMGQEAPLSLI